MEVSVIIPVYNAEHFIIDAVRSVLAQPEVQEVLLIEDGSTDQSYRICQQLAQEKRVKVLTHPGHVNKGAAASRNLGIRSATQPFLAFLDADDTCEPGRFTMTKKVFDEHPDADGVHEIIGIRYHDPALQKLTKSDVERTGIKITVAPEHLFRTIATGKHGHISLDGLVLKASALKDLDLLDTNFQMSEDSEFILRLAASRRLYSGDLSRIVAKRGMHGRNSIMVNPHIMHYRKSYLQKCVDQKFYGSHDLTAKLYILTRRVGAGNFYKPFRKLGKLALPIKLIGITGYLLARPKVLWNLIANA